MKRWNRILATLLAAIMLMGVFSATAELALEFDNPDVNESIDLDIMPEAYEDVLDADLELSDELEVEGLDIEEVVPEAEAAEDAVDGAEAEASSSIQSNDDSDFNIDENGVLVKYTGDGGDVVIPYGVTSIGDNAFAKTNYWGNYTADTSLKSVTIPDSVTSIGASAFKGCRGLTSVTTPDSVISIGTSAFDNCKGLTSVTIGNRVTSIGETAFLWCNSLTSVNMGNSVTSIGEYAFQYCESLNSITIPNSVTTIAKYAFSKCSKLTSVSLPNKLQTIEEGLFWDDQSLANITIPDSLTSIGKYAFKECESLSSVIIPGSVTSIGDEAFYSCSSLTSVTIYATNVSIGSNAFHNTQNGIQFHIVCNSNVANNFSSDRTTLLHNTVDTPYVEPTYTEPGRTAGTKCTVCGKVISGNETIPPIDFNKARISLEVNDSYTLEIRSLGTRSVTWSSSDKSIASVINGTVTAVSEGECMIYATFGDGYRLTCDVTVEDQAKLSKSKLSLDVGKTSSLSVNGLSGRTVKWSSSDKKIATVKDGTVTAIREGTCTITATLSNGKMLTCALTVKDPAWISYTKLSMEAGETYPLKVYKIADRTITWFSSNKKIATVKDGKVTAIKAGTCTITATLSNGKTFKCKVTVKDVAKFTKNKLTMKPGDAQTLKISGLNNRKVTWSSSDKNVATVKDGKVKGVGIGKCTITAQIEKGKKLTCKLTVTDPAALSAEKLTISTIDTERIELTGGLKRKVTWSTSNSGVVKITNSDSSAATIKAVKTGTATITAKIEGGKTLKCVVTVVEPVTLKNDGSDVKRTDDAFGYQLNTSNFEMKLFNNTNKIITKIDFDILMYDSQWNQRDSFHYDWSAWFDSIAPHEYGILDFNFIGGVKCIRLTNVIVTFADKTTWRP